MRCRRYQEFLEFQGWGKSVENEISILTDNNFKEDLARSFFFFSFCRVLFLNNPIRTLDSRKVKDFFFCLLPYEPDMQCSLWILVSLSTLSPSLSCPQAFTKSGEEENEKSSSFLPFFPPTPPFLFFERKAMLGQDKRLELLIIHTALNNSTEEISKWL